MNKTQFKELITSMPPLRHDSGDIPFNIEKSEPIQWLLSQPKIKEWIWGRMRGSGRLIYNPATGLWNGVYRKSHAEKQEVTTEDWS